MGATPFDPYPGLKRVRNIIYMYYLNHSYLFSRGVASGQTQNLTLPSRGGPGAALS